MTRSPRPLPAAASVGTPTALAPGLALDAAGDRADRPDRPGGPAPHPSDGPDLDVRARIDEDGLHLRISINLAYVDEHVGFVRELDGELHAVEMKPLEDDLVAYFADAVEVRIDGAAVEGVPDRPLSQLPGPREMVPYNPEYGIRALTLIYLDLDYAIPEAEAADGPQRVDIVWKSFPPDLAQPMDDPPPMVARLQVNDGTGDVPIDLTVDEPGWTWHGEVTTYAERLLPVVDPPEPEFVEIPVASAAFGALAVVLFAAAALGGARKAAVAGLLALVAGGATFGVARVPYEVGSGGTVTAAEAQRAFENLHTNLYTAFDFDDREVVYDALASVVGGDHLDRTYGRVFKSLILEDDGGAVTRVTAVRHLDTEVETIGFLAEYDTDGFVVRSRWQVDGRVTHFGHTHERTQEYEARFAVGDTPDGWRILGDEVLSDFVVSARQIDPRRSGGFELRPVGEVDDPVEGEL